MEKKEKNEKFRDRKFALLLYPEDDSHVDALEVIKQSYDYAYILHDKDLDEDGKIKKSHWHVLITTGKNQKWSSALAEDLKITENYIRKVKNLDRALEYLIHLNDEDKHQYSIDEVCGTLKLRLAANMNASDKTEGEKVLELIQVIEDSNRITVTEIAKHSAKSGCWDVFRRSGGIFIRIIDEHNMKYDTEYEQRKIVNRWEENFNRRTGEIYDTPFDGKQMVIPEVEHDKNL
jgi:hypothetical protein